MHLTVKNFIEIQEEIKEKILESKINRYDPSIIAVSKTFKFDHINQLSLLNSQFYDVWFLIFLIHLKKYLFLRMIGLCQISSIIFCEEHQ